MMTSGDFSVYIHVPFCTKKCPYCHFYVLPNRDHQILLDGLKREWEMRRVEGRCRSIYFGGGTPSLLGPEKIEEILSWLPEAEEITLEANPGDPLEGFGSIVNRMSIGVQSLDNALLKRIGRTHSVNDAIEAVEKAGVENISIDLMLDLPDQTLHQVRQTFRRAAKLPITHLSLYNLVVEPPSLFAKKPPEQPDETTSLKMLEVALEELSDFERYEISAFSRDEKRSIHNTGYWTGRPYIGLGPSAWSYWDGVRFANPKSLKRWARALEKGELPHGEVDALSERDRASELFAVRLRLKEGAQEVPDHLREKVDELHGLGLLEANRLTERGRLLYDRIATELIA